MSPSTSAGMLGVLAELARSRSVDSGLDDMTWRLCQQAAEPLGLQDCVIYLLDKPGGHMLEQRAAYGPKNPRGREILNPISIPVGRGIVGSVAADGRPERISDTSQDSRYIVDDDVRLSELAAPIIHDGKVIGVLDSEHPEKEFFRREQLDAISILLEMWSHRLGETWADESPRAVRLNVDALSHRLDGAEGVHDRQRALGVLNHELRTPLNAILGYGSLLEEGLPEDDPEQGQLLATMMRNGRKLADRLEQVLALPGLFALDSGQEPNLVDVDLAALVRHVVGSAGRPGPAISIRLDLPPTCRTLTNAETLSSALRALLDNALKYTVEGSVTVRLASRPGEEWCLLIEDTGCGIPEGELERIFEPFYQVGGSVLSRQREGLGLGLTIAEHACGRLGYRLGVESEPGVGTVFSIRLKNAGAKLAAR